MAVLKLTRSLALKNIKSKKSQQGKIALWMIGGVMLSAATSFYALNQKQANQINDLANNYSEEFKTIIDASNACHYRTRNWCTFAELSAGGYYSGNERSSDNSLFQLNPTAAGLEISLDMPTQQLASMVTQTIPNAALAGNRLTSLLPIPSANEIMADRLMRYEDAAELNRNSFEVDIDINDNNLNNINSLGADNATIEELTALNSTIETTNINSRLGVGAHSISSSGNALDVEAPNINLNSDLAVQDNLIGNNTDISGINTVTANLAFIEDANVFSASIENASIASASINDLTVMSGFIGNNSGDNMDFNSGNFEELSSFQSDITTANIINAMLNSLTASEGRIDELTVGNVSGNNASFDTIYANSWDIDAADLVNVQASTINLSSLVTTNTFAGRINVDLANLDNVTVDTINGGSAVFTSLETDNLTSQNINSSITANNGNISNTLKAKNVTANNSSANLLNLNNINASNSNIGKASASSVNATNTSLRQVSATNANIKTITASSFLGGMASGSDFKSSNSTVNQNYQLLRQLRDDIDDCVNVTKYCIPQTPSVSLSCPDCFLSDFRSNFAGMVTATINGCRQGCSYRWVTRGTGLRFSSCTSGSVPRGGSARPTCRVSASLSPQESASGSIKIIVTNNHYPDSISNDTVAVSFVNLNADDPFEQFNVKGGCLIDTFRLDITSIHFCSANGLPNAGVLFSVGDKLGRELLEFTSLSDWSISWSGDCIGSGSVCRTNLSVRSGAQLLRSMATVTHLPSNKKKNFSIDAIACVTPSGFMPNC